MKSVFDIPIEQMPRVRPGTPVRADDFNTHSEAIERIQKGVRPAQQVNPIVGGSGELIACTIVSIHKDHLVCTRKDGGSIKVARPRAARSPATETIQGQAFNYTYTDVVIATTPPTGYQARTAISQPTTTQQEEQILLREYKVDQEIDAARVIGGTSVTEAPDYVEVHSDRTWYRKAAAS